MVAKSEKDIFFDVLIDQLTDDLRAELGEEIGIRNSHHAKDTDTATDDLFAKILNYRARLRPYSVPKLRSTGPSMVHSRVRVTDTSSDKVVDELSFSSIDGTFALTLLIRLGASFNEGEIQEVSATPTVGQPTGQPNNQSPLTDTLKVSRRALHRERVRLLSLHHPDHGSGESRDIVAVLEAFSALKRCQI